MVCSLFLLVLLCACSTVHKQRQRTAVTLDSTALYRDTSLVQTLDSKGRASGHLDSLRSQTLHDYNREIIIEEFAPEGDSLAVVRKRTTIFIRDRVAGSTDITRTGQDSQYHRRESVDRRGVTDSAHLKKEQKTNDVQVQKRRTFNAWWVIPCIGLVLLWLYWFAKPYQKTAATLSDGLSGAESDEKPGKEG